MKVFLKADAIITRSGIFLYSNTDGSIRKELRDPKEVFNQDSLDTLDMKPITLHHPKQRIVTADNSAELKVGNMGENARRVGNDVRISMLITDKKAIKAVKEDNIQELSLGYSLELDETPGIFEGEHYDAKQYDIKYNHLAIVPSARAGNKARIVLDRCDGYQVDEDRDIKQPKEKKKMLKNHVNIDGIEYEAAPEVVNALSKTQAHLDTLESEFTKIKNDLSETKAKLDTAVEEVTKLKEQNNDEAILVGVQKKNDSYHQSNSSFR